MLTSLSLNPGSLQHDHQIQNNLLDNVRCPLPKNNLKYHLPIDIPQKILSLINITRLFHNEPRLYKTSRWVSSLANCLMHVETQKNRLTCNVSRVQTCQNKFHNYSAYRVRVYRDFHPATV